MRHICWHVPCFMGCTGSGPPERSKVMRNDSTALLCLACYKDRLASVCENADEYRLFEIRDGKKIYPAGHLSLPSKDPMDRTSAILACGVSLLLCGAICADTRARLEAGGVTLFPWITGSVDEVLAAFRAETLSALAMPGRQSRFGTQRRRRRGTVGGTGRQQSHWSQQRRDRRSRGGQSPPSGSAI